MTPTQYALMKSDPQNFMSVLPPDMRDQLLGKFIGISIHCRRCKEKHWYSEGQYTYVPARPAGFYCYDPHDGGPPPTEHLWDAEYMHKARDECKGHVFLTGGPARVRAKCAEWDTVIQSFAPNWLKD